VCKISKWEDALGLLYEPLPYLTKFLVIPLKATIFEKLAFNILMEFLVFVSHYYDGGRPQISVKSLWHAADQPKKTGLNIFTCLSCWESRPEAKSWRSY
jgi:hypothetical protein